jgi:RNA polymerase sigma factor (sigma-70 family)
MQPGTLNTVVRHLRRSMLRQDFDALTDGELLGDYVTHADPAAFEALVCRHGPMVLGVCRRILGNAADAEDAFQATFLVLVRKARSIEPRGQVSHWLYGVARNTALKARARNRQRAAREREVGARVADTTTPEREEWLISLLDEALSGLPEKYRIPIVMCHLQGKTIQEVARDLDWPPGTVACRLARGRDMLGRRLARQGQVLPAALPAVAVPVPLLAATVQGATQLAGGQALAAVASPAIVALMEGVLRTMLLTKLKSALLMLALLVGVGVSVALFPAAQATGQPTQGKEGVPPAVLGDELGIKAAVPPGPSWKVRAVYPFEKGGSVVGAILTPDGKRVVVAQAEHISAIELENGKLLWRNDQAVPCGVAITGDGKVVSTYGMLWDATTGKLRAELGSSLSTRQGKTGGVAFTPDGKLVAMASGRRIRMWDVASSLGNNGTEVRTFATTSDLLALVISPDGKTMALSLAENHVKLCDLTTAEEKRSLSGHTKEVRAVAFSPDGKTIATGSDDALVRLWDAATGKLTSILKGHNGPVASVAFSPDGKTIASVGQIDRTLHIWDRQTGQDVGTYKEHTKELSAVLFSPDGKFLVTVGSDAVRIWERAPRPAPVVTPPQPDRLTFADRLAALPTELVNSKKGDNDTAEALFLAVLQRFPAEAEREHVTKHLKTARNREEASRDLLWAMVNTREFLQLHGLGDNLAGAREFTEKISKAWEKK